MKRISVVIPSYNHAPFIGEAIRSVAAQGLADLELVIIDDGSQDASVEQIEHALGETTIEHVIFERQENRGAHDALMRGIAASRGEVIALLNSDDRYAPDRFVQMAPHFAERDEFIAFSMVRVIDDAGAPVPHTHPTAAGVRHALHVATRCPTVGFGLLCNNFAVTSGNFVFSRSLYDRLGGFSEHRLAHDWDFLLRALVHVEPIFVPVPLIDYRVHRSNTIHGVGHLDEEEGAEILGRYLTRCREETANRLAPCPQNWPLYFDLFTRRHAPWFGGPSIRRWIDAQAIDHASEKARPRWQRWSEAAGLGAADDFAYITAPGEPAASLDAIAVAREALQADAHPLAHESPDDALSVLSEVFERWGHAIPSEPSGSREVGARFTPGGDLAEAGTARGENGTHKPDRKLRTALRRRLGAMARLRRPTTWEIERSRLFDAEYYIAANALNALPRSQALRHYIETGASQGLAPHPLFDGAYYLESHPDVAASGANPLVHYLAHGAEEGRDPHPLFDTRFYLESNPDVARMGINPLSHYVRHGAFEGREPHPRFDSGYYRAQCPEPIPDDVSPLAHYVLVGAELGVAISHADALRSRLATCIQEPNEDGQARPPFGIGGMDAATRRLRFSGFFDPAYYASQARGSIETDDPLRHFLEVGSLAGIPPCSPRTLRDRMLSIDARTGARPEHVLFRADVCAPLPTNASVELRLHQEGSPLYRELAELLAFELDRLGAKVCVADERTPPGPETTHSWIFAPHEYFTLGSDPQPFDARMLARSFVVMAEAPGSPWFSTGIWFARRALGVLDINPGSAAVWHEMGFRALFLPLAGAVCPTGSSMAARESILRGALGAQATRPVPAIDAAIEERPLDVFYDGEPTLRRYRFFAKEASLFASLRCALFLPTPFPEPTCGPASALSNEEATTLARSAKLVLALQQGEAPCLDWHRSVIRGMGQGALLVAEEGMRLPGLTAGEHYFSAPLDEIASLLHWLIETPEGRSKAESVRRNGIDVLHQRFAPQNVLPRLLRDCGTGGES